nr:MAG TPA: hypothetical protein [Caudoviricetes sp.]
MSPSIPARCNHFANSTVLTFNVMLVSILRDNNPTCLSIRSYPDEGHLA